MRIVNQDRTESVEMEAGVVDVMNNIIRFRSVYDREIKLTLGVYKTSIRAQKVFEDMLIEYRMSSIYEMPKE